MTHVAMNLIQHLSHIRWSSRTGLPQGLGLLTLGFLTFVRGHGLVVFYDLRVVLAVTLCPHIKDIMLLMLFPTLLLCSFQDDCTESRWPFLSKLGPSFPTATWHSPLSQNFTMSSRAIATLLADDFC